MSLFLLCTLTTCGCEAFLFDGGYRDAASVDAGNEAAVRQGEVDSPAPGACDAASVDAGNEAAVDRGAVDSSAPGACTAGRRILVDEVINARDMGGVPLKNGEMVACGALYRGAALTALSEMGCAEFVRFGIRTVIDLRTADERIAGPYSSCVVNRVRTILAPMPVPTYVSPEDYIADLSATDSVAASFDAFGDETAYPIYFNCYYGRDRTGVLAVVILLTLGATREDVLAEYQLTHEAGLTVYPDSIEAVLDEIEKRGGIEAYLASAGVSSNQIAVLRAQAIAP